MFSKLYRKKLIYFVKIFPLFGLFYNNLRYRHLKIGLYCEIQNNGEFHYKDHCVIGQYSRIDILNNSKIVLGNDVHLSRNVYLRVSREFINIEENVRIQDNNRILGNVHIMKDTIIGPNCFIASGTHNYNLEPNMTIREQDKLAIIDKKVTIGEDCWIGINSFIAPGVTLGKGCVVAANSAVTKSFPDYSVIGGVPAKLIKSRI